MNCRERLLATLRYQPVDRPAFVMPWLGFSETFDRWRREGYVDGDLDRYPCERWRWEGHWFFPHPPFDHTVIDEDASHVVYVNEEGIMLREFKNNPSSSMPQFVRFPVQNRDDFRAFAATRLQPHPAARFGPNWVADLKTLRDKDAPLWIIADRWGGFFGPLRNLLGVEELCVRFYTDPAMIEEMMDTIADFMIALVGQVLDHIEIDVFGFWEDMAYRNGPLISPQLVRKYMLPRYRRVVDYVRSRGVEWICLDSDGRIDELVPIWLDAGINIVYPFEVTAGMDVVAMRREYGRDLRMLMGMGKKALVDGPEAIDREIARVLPLVEDGGYVANFDHSLPPDVSYDHFRYYMDAMAKALGV
ncbi:MAG: hypothetical protein KJ052_02125 [Candidatus Hydrogenedentes bacterium]|nr:hypothetical protein [Candidatus Hydrogenedentota bacterium]